MGWPSPPGLPSLGIWEAQFHPVVDPTPDLRLISDPQEVGFVHAEQRVREALVAQDPKP